MPEVLRMRYDFPKMPGVRVSGLCCTNNWQLSQVTSDLVKKEGAVRVSQLAATEITNAVRQRSPSVVVIVERPKLFRRPVGYFLANFLRQVAGSCPLLFLPVTLFCRQPIAAVCCLGARYSSTHFGEPALLLEM